MFEATGRDVSVRPIVADIVGLTGRLAATAMDGEHCPADMQGPAPSPEIFHAIPRSAV